jgi:hypothetical protein
LAPARIFSHKLRARLLKEGFTEEPVGCYCADGWICEQHADRPWPHDDCAGPGMPCANVNCQRRARLLEKLNRLRPTDEEEA